MAVCCSGGRAAPLAQGRGELHRAGVILVAAQSVSLQGQLRWAGAHVRAEVLGTIFGEILQLLLGTVPSLSNPLPSLFPLRWSGSTRSSCGGST